MHQHAVHVREPALRLLSICSHERWLAHHFAKVEGFALERRGRKPVTNASARTNGRGFRSLLRPLGIGSGLERTGDRGARGVGVSPLRLADLFVALLFGREC